MNTDVTKDAVNNKTIFISWSGDKSREIAEELKNTLEKIFSNKVTCFVSTQSIASGEDWYKKIKNELEKSDLGILCITKENIKAPWLYFEAGALVGNDLKVIPLLISCNQASLDRTPIRANQSIQFYNSEQFKKMLKDIRNEFGLMPDMDERVINDIFVRAYKDLKKDLTSVLNELKLKKRYLDNFIYPEDVNTMTMNTVYISAPMSTISEDEYKEQQDFLIKLIDELKKRNIDTIHCPASCIGYGEWDGITTAVYENYSKLKQAQHLLVIYPRAIPTSSLVETGYGIALCKNTVVFYKEELPYLIKDAGQDIKHLHTRPYKKLDDIAKEIKKDRNLFEVSKND